MHTEIESGENAKKNNEGKSAHFQSWPAKVISIKI